MSLINKEIIEDLVVWAADNENKDIYPMISPSESSYYIDRCSEDTYLMDYSFRTLTELKSGLEEYGGLSKESLLLRKVVVELCQNRYMRKGNLNEREQVKREKKDRDTLPEYVYTI